MSVVIFPGQGSQQKGMGLKLFDEFQEQISVAERILEYSVREICLEDSDNRLNSTEFTQPLLYIVNALHYLNRLRTADPPDYLAGHSLGEYNALLAAGVFDFETGLKLVQERGRLMSGARNGAMLALVRTDENQVREIMARHNLDQIDIANLNSPSQIVLSASTEDLARAKSIFENEDVLCIPLKASGAFHSRLMKPLAGEFARFVSKFEFNPVRIPVIANTTARPYDDESLKKTLIDQIFTSVKWTDSIRYLMAQHETVFDETGPGQILTRLTADIVKNSTPLKITEVENKEAKPQDAPGSPKSSENHTAKLGAQTFLDDYGVRHAYVAGSMCNGISSVKLISRMARAGFLSFFGSAGLALDEIESAIKHLHNELDDAQPFGMNLLMDLSNPSLNQELVDLYLRHEVRNLELSGFTQPTAELVKFRVLGLKKNASGTIQRRNKIILKTSKPAVAKLFMAAPPKHLVEKLLTGGEISPEQASLSESVSLVDDICVEGDSGWRTSQAVTLIALPEVISIRDSYDFPADSFVRIGSSGGLGTPAAIAAVFGLGADFVLTGSINQCSVEADVSDEVKDLLEGVEPQDLSYAPSGESFETGGRVQIVRKNLFFASRAQKLYDIYRLYDGLDQLEPKTLRQLEDHFFGRSLSSVYEEVKKRIGSDSLAEAEKNAKYKMALIFKSYFYRAASIAKESDARHFENCQIYCGPALGAFNQWVRGTDLEKWSKRNVDDIGKRLMHAAEKIIEPKIMHAATGK